MQQENKIAVMPMGKLLLEMSWPLMMSLLFQSLYNIVDGIFVARYSEAALTATSLIYAVQALMIAVSVGTSVGLNSVLSRKVGAGDEEGACNTATTGLFLALLSGAVFSFVGIFFSGTISRMLTDDPELQELCETYMGICVVFCYGTFLHTYGQRLLQAVGDTIMSMVSLLVGAGVNIILDPILIFGLLGFPSMGIRGAAIATVIGQFSGAASALLLNRWRNPIIHVHFKGYHFELQDVKDIYQVGLPTIIMQAVGSVMTFAVNEILLGISSTAVAFWGVYYKLQSFLMMPMNGLGQALIPIVGYNYGAKNPGRIREAWKIALPIGIGFALVGTAVFMIFPRQLLTLYSASETMMAMGVPALRIISVSFIGAVITIICGYFATGLGNGTINMIGALLRQLVILVPLLYLFIRFFGLSFAWYALWVAEAVAAVYSLVATRRELAKKVPQSGQPHED